MARTYCSTFAEKQVFGFFRAYPVYTVGESALYTNQGQYYAANAGATATTGTVGYSTTGGHYLVQQTVDGETLIATARNSPQTTSAVSTNMFLCA